MDPALLWQTAPSLGLAFLLGWLVKNLTISKSMERLRNALSEAQADAMNREAEVLTLSSRLQNTEADDLDNSRLRSMLTGKDQEIASLRDQLKHALEERSNAVTAAAARLEELDGIHSDTLTARDVEIARLRRELDSQKLEVTRLSTFVQTLEPLSMQLSEAERELTASVEAKNAEIARLSTQVRQLESAMSLNGAVAPVEPPAELQREIASLQAALESKEAEVRRLTLLARDLEQALRSTPESAVPHHEEPPAHWDDPGAVQRELSAAVNGSRIDFLEDGAEIEPASRYVLDGIAAVLHRYPGTPVEITGHTEEGPDFWHNYELSRRRAAAVREYLAAKGVSAASLTEAGCGQTRPIADNSSLEGRRTNRRIEFRVATEVLNAREIARTAAASR